LFKAIIVGNSGKLVSSACYDKHPVCVYYWIVALQQKSRILKEYQNLTPPYGRHFEQKGPKLKSTVNTEKYRVHIVLVYLQPFPANSLLKCAAA